jgi:hypothetical protein
MLLTVYHLVDERGIKKVFLEDVLIDTRGSASQISANRPLLKKPRRIVKKNKK